MVTTGTESEADGSTPTCFVIGPIGSEHAPIRSDERTRYEESQEVWEEIIVPACEEVGIELPVRADQLARAGEITEQIFRRLQSDDVVIADVTDANPNVMYELGLRHTLDRLTIQIGEFDRLPFDVNVIRTIQFSRSPNSFVKARKRLADILRSGILGEFDPVTATRVWCGDRPGSEPFAEPAPIAATIEPADAPGILDLIADADEKIDRVYAAMSALNKDLASLNELAEATANEMQQANARGAGAKAMLHSAAKLAAQLNPVADSLAQHVDEYLEGMSSVGAAVEALISILEDDPNQIATASTWAIPVRGMAAQARGASASLGGLVSAMQSGLGFARVLRAPSARIRAAIDRFTSSLTVLDQWDRRLQVLGVPLPSDG